MSTAGEVIDICVGDRPVVALTPLEHRVKVGLVMPPAGRVVDISVHPAAACRALTEAARDAREPPESVESAARTALVRAAEQSGCWVPSAERCLAGAIGGVAFPLLGGAYDLRATPLDEVPRWAVPVLAAPTVGDGAKGVFGASATRPVRRALVEAIRPLPTGQVDLAVLAMALMAADVLQPDRLARVLCAPSVGHPVSDLPDPATLHATRRVLQDWGEVRCERILTEAAARPDGLRVLLDTARYARDLHDHGPQDALPQRLGDLHDVYRALMPSAADPANEPGPRGRRVQDPHSSPATATDCRPARPPHRVLAPATELRPVNANTALPLPAATRSLHGTAAGQLRLVLPRTAGDLGRWGRLLGNCLGDFAPSAASGRALIIGVERANRLLYAVEITPNRCVRQFSGRGNRPPAPTDRLLVVRALVTAGVLDPRAPANVAWVAGLDVEQALAARAAGGGRC